MIHTFSIENLQSQFAIQEELTENESLLVRECAKKNRLAQRVLYEQNYPKLLGVAMRYLSNQAEAEDVLHDSFIGIFKNIRKFKGKSALSTWLTRIVINDSIAYLRKKNKSLVEYKDEIDYDNAEEIKEEEIAKYNCERLLDLMNELPVGYRTVLCMYSIDGLSHKEIGEHLGISESSSRSQLSRARESFREILKGKEEKDAA